MDEDWSWIGRLAAELPQAPQVRKTIFELAGFPHWENVNSNLLAFYFNEQEEHGFGRLFFHSLLQLLREKDKERLGDLELYQSEYLVEREVTAQRQRIDLVIRSVEGDGDSWAIIIENKLNALLYNDLKTYWQGVKADKRTGVVLSLADVSKQLKEFEAANPGMRYINIRHHELVAKVKVTLAASFLESDDRHLLLLKDYMQNIHNMDTAQNAAISEQQLRCTGNMRMR